MNEDSSDLLTGAIQFTLKVAIEFTCDGPVQKILLQEEHGVRDTATQLFPLSQSPNKPASPSFFSSYSIFYYIEYLGDVPISSV